MFLKADDPLEVMRRPYLRLGNILQLAFTEFCTNKFFGVDSYIGRRIRHGTLKGFMVTDLHTIFFDTRFDRLHSHPLLGRYLKDWIEKYEQTVDQIGSEWFHIKSSKKQQGVIDPNILSLDKVSTSLVFVTDVMGWLREVESAGTVVSLVYEYCWLLLEKDLVKVRRQIDQKRLEVAVLDRRQMEILCGEDMDDLLVEISREASQLAQEKFRAVANWFTRPKNLSPSATVSLLIDAVISEVKGYFFNFSPHILRDGDGDIEIFGYRYHHLYDFLYVVVYNAARHGNPSGVVKFDTRLLIREPGVLSLAIDVSSELRPGDTVDHVTSRVLSAMGSNPDDAMVIEVNSGISKIRKMEMEVQEIRRFNFQIEGRMITFSFEMTLTSGPSDVTA